MSNVKVNSSSDFSLAFDLSAALRLWVPPVPSPWAGRGCLALHTPGKNSRQLLLAEQTRAKGWLSQIFPLKRLALHVCLYTRWSLLVPFFFHLWCSCQEGNPKSVTTKAAQSLPAQLLLFTHHIFWGLDRSSSSSRRGLDVTVWGPRCL